VLGKLLCISAQNVLNPRLHFYSVGDVKQLDIAPVSAKSRTGQDTNKIAIKMQNSCLFFIKSFSK